MRTIWLAAVLMALMAAPARAGERADMQVRFAATAAGAPTGLTLHLRYKAAGDPEAKPSPIRMVALRLPDGTGLPLGAHPACEASDEELQLLGVRACPAESRIGDGSLTVVTGFGAPVDPFATDVTLFNMRSGLLELVTEAGSGATLAIERLTLEDGWLVGHPAIPPGGPPDGASGVRDIDWTVPPGYFTTPEACPRSGEWATRGRFRFEDGVEVEEVAVTPCVRAAPRVRRLLVKPRQVRAGRALRVEVRLPTTGRCRVGAVVSVGGRRAVSDGRGRAVLRVVLRPGRHRVSSRRPGCAPREGWLLARG